MKTQIDNQQDTIDIELSESIKQLNRAQRMAWGMFIFVGIAYTVLSLIVAF